MIKTYPQYKYPLTEVETEVLEEVEVVEETQNSRSLVVYNDDVNTFEHVIISLQQICHHTPHQAEQCAFIVHYNGKCGVKEGSYDDLKPMKEALQERGITVKIH